MVFRYTVDLLLISETHQSGNTDEEKSSASRVDFHSLKMRTAVSPKRNTGNRAMRGPLGLSIVRSRSYREEQKKDLSLSEGVRLSERFQTIERTIYGIGFTCVVVMGINRDTQEVCAPNLLLFFIRIPVRKSRSR